MRNSPSEHTSSDEGLPDTGSSIIIHLKLMKMMHSKSSTSNAGSLQSERDLSKKARGTMSVSVRSDVTAPLPEELSSDRIMIPAFSFTVTIGRLAGLGSTIGHQLEEVSESLGSGHRVQRIKV